MRSGRSATAFCLGVVCALAAAAPGSLAASRAQAASGPAGLAPASALLLYERNLGTIVYAQHASVELPIASLTKMMTAYVTVEREPAGSVLTEQPYAAGPGESLAGVPAGTRLGLADMLRAMLLPSGNDVANSLAIDVGGSVPRFVALMNFWAAELKLGETSFTTPIGLDTPTGNHSTALDLARLANVLLRDPLVASAVDKPSAQLADGQVMDNRNDLVGTYDWVVGVKTGHTADAGYCLVGAARVDGVQLISVVLGASSERTRDADTLALLRYGLQSYRRAVIARRGQAFARLPVTGRRRRVGVIATRPLALVLPRAVALHASLVLPQRLTGPLPAGANVGRIIVSESGHVTARVPLVTAAAVPAPPPVARRRAWIVWVSAAGVLGGILAGCSLTLMRRRARRTAAVVVSR